MFIVEYIMFYNRDGTPQSGEGMHHPTCKKCKQLEKEGYYDNILSIVEIFSVTCCLDWQETNKNNIINAINSFFIIYNRDGTPQSGEGMHHPTCKKCKQLEKEGYYEHQLLL